MEGRAAAAADQHPHAATLVSTQQQQPPSTAQQLQPVAAAAADGEQQQQQHEQQQQKEAEQQAYCAAIKTEFQDLLAEFANGLSEQDFDPLCEKLRNADNTLSGTGYLADFRAMLVAALHNDHDTFWHSNYVDDGLACLREVVASSRQAVGSTPAWRPTGRSAAEQVRFYRTFQLRAKVAYLQKQLASQQPQMQHMIVRLEELRGRMEEMQARRKTLDAQIDLRWTELRTADETLRSLQAELDA